MQDKSRIQKLAERIKTDTKLLQNSQKTQTDPEEQRETPEMLEKRKKAIARLRTFAED